MPQRLAPDDPREWLNRAQSDLQLASSTPAGVYLEDLCYHAQQAAEKAIKAVFIHRGLSFPYVHDIARLLTLLESNGERVPLSVQRAKQLTRFAVFSRYPGVAPAIKEREYDQAVRQAQRVLRWAERVINK
jgi:HEPN domain-containing protein